MKYKKYKKIQNILFNLLFILSFFVIGVEEQYE
jgi:hypothetical protein